MRVHAVLLTKRLRKGENRVAASFFDGDSVSVGIGKVINRICPLLIGNRRVRSHWRNNA